MIRNHGVVLRTAAVMEVSLPDGGTEIIAYELFGDGQEVTVHTEDARGGDDQRGSIRSWPGTLAAPPNPHVALLLYRPPSAGGGVFLRVRTGLPSWPLPEPS